jgi:hypothetical protein
MVMSPVELGTKNGSAGVASSNLLDRPTDRGSIFLETLLSVYYNVTTG